MKSVFVLAVSSMASLWSPAIIAMAARETPKAGLLRTSPNDRSRKLGAILKRYQTHMALLADAEKQHDKTVNGLRGKVSTLLENEAEAFGTLVRSYGLELEQVADVLAQCLNVTRQELSRANNETVLDKSQRMSEQRKQVSIKAETDAAERMLNRVEEHSANLVRQALLRAEQPLVNAVDELSLHLGDMSSESQAMNAKLRSASSTGHQFTEGGTPSRDEAIVKLTSNGTLLAEDAHVRSLVAAAAIRFNTRLANETQKLQSEVQGIKEGFEAAKQQELKLLRGAKRHD